MTVDYIIKLLIIGDGSVGKTSLVKRYAEGYFTLNYLPTLGVDITTKTSRFTISERVGGIRVKLILVDVAGQEFFGKLRPEYYRGGFGALVVFALNTKSSLKNIGGWIREFITLSETKTSNFVLVGNKRDLVQNNLEKYILVDEIEKVCEKYGLTYVDTSAKTGYNVDVVFQLLASKILESIDAKRTYKEKKPLSSKQDKFLSTFAKKYKRKIDDRKVYKIPNRDLWNIYQSFDDFKNTQDLSSSFIRKFLALFRFVEPNDSRKNEALIKGLHAKILVLFADTMEFEGKLDLYIGIYLDGIKNYLKALDFLDPFEAEDPREYDILKHALTDLFNFYSNMIIQPIDLNKITRQLDRSPDIRALGFRYGDRFFRFFEQCLNLRQFPSFKSYQDLSDLLSKIELIFDKDNPYLILIKKTYEMVLNYIPQILVEDRAFFPNPLVYGEPALVNIRIRNILDKKTNVKLDIFSSTEISLTKSISLDPLKGTELTIPLGNINTTTVWLQFKIFVKNGRTHKYLYQDQLQQDVGEPQSPLFIRIEALEKQQVFKDYSKLKLSVFLINTKAESLNISLVVEGSWLSSLREYSIKELKAQELEKFDLDLEIPKSLGIHTLKLKFLDKNNNVIPNTEQQIEIEIKESTKGKIIRYIKGVAGFTKAATKIITKV